MVELNEYSAGECSVSSASTTQSNQKFSILKWFKKSPKSTTHQTEKSTTEAENFFTSCDSVDTLYSTTTVRSFDFHTGKNDGSEGQNFIDLSHQSPKKVGPFGAGAAKIVRKKGGNIQPDVTRTLPANVLSRGRDITARYSLQNCTASFGSCGNVRHQRDLYRSGKLPETRPHVRRVHVRGKRKAPSPPVIGTRPKSVCENGRSREITPVVAESCRRKRRPAPKPPEIPGWSKKSTNEGMDIDKFKNGLEVIKNTSECGSYNKVVEYDFENKNSDVVQKLGKSSGDQNLNEESVDGSDFEILEAHDSVILDINHLKKESNKSQIPARKVYDFETINNDTLVLQGGFLLPRKDPGSTATLPFIQNTHKRSAMPRPWYKRSVFEHSQSKENSTTGTTSKNTGNEGSLRSFFHRSSDKNTDEKRKETKRKSGLSILTNISELDKEAAAIVQEEQARSRAALLLQSSRLKEVEKRSNDNEEIIQDMVTSSMENSPRKGTRALISKFNAIGNITRVSVNTNFFAKKGSSESREDVWRREQRAAEMRKTNRDLSRYFPRQPTIVSEQQPPIINSILKQSPNPSPKLDPKVATTRSQFLEEFKSKNTSPRSMRSLGADAGSHQDAMGSGKSLANVNSPKLLRVKVTEHRNTASEKFTDGSCSSEAIQREFSDIFEAIDMQLTPKNSRTDQRLKNSVATSSQVDKVLDILVQAEKEVRKNDKVRTTVVNNNDPVKDLKEMLKEMKHSLPKRPKPRKTGEFTEKQNTEISNIKLLESVKVTGPPVVQFGPAKANCRNLERSKVSSGVQTSGNVRKVESSTSGLFSKEFVVPSKSENSTGAIGKTFHLMRPREFAAIEAIMTTKNSQEDNTYANVIEKSIYANAIVLPPRNHRMIHIPDDGPRNIRMKTRIPDPVGITKTSGKSTIPFVNADDEDEMAMAQKMNTLAVNRLLKRLEAAIASGNHQQAAGLAKDLAKLKIQCSVVRQRTKTRNLLNVDMYIEDRLAHQGPIPLQLPITMTVAQLKEKIFNEFQIPTNVQRWIIGRTLADNDELTLEDLQAVEGLPVFLYLAAPVFQIGDKAGVSGKASEDDKMRDLIEENENEYEELAGKYNILEKNDEDLPEVLNESDGDDEIEEVTIEEENEKEVNPVIAEQIEQENGETNEKKSDNNEEGAVGLVKEIRMEQYNELMMLENCGLVPTTDSIECPICFMIYGPNEGIILRDCLHAFCRTCIENTIRYCGEAEVKCPYMNSEYTCESTLQEREIKALVDPQMYEKHLAKSVSQAENNAGHHAFHCKKPDCPGWCIYDDNVNNFLCPVCNMTNCLTCRVIHSGKNCWEYQEDVRLSKETDQESKRTAAMLTEMLDRGEAMACPTCDVVLMKKWGCDWLRCSMCKTEICWVTRGPRWGPLGKGDTSGGCRCGENGVKCHPRCNYCH